MKQTNGSIIHRTILFLFLCCFIQTSMAQNQQTYTLHLEKVSLKEFIQEVEKHTPYTFIYGENVRLSHPITLHATRYPIQKILSEALDDQLLHYEIKAYHVILTPSEKKESAKQRRNHTISGFIKDKRSGETLLGANVYDTNSLKGTATNQFGFYTLTIPEGAVAINVSYLGYQTQHPHFYLSKDTVVNILMVPSENQLEEVVVTSTYKEAGLHSMNPGSVEIPMTQIKNTPTFLGEPDLLKTIQLMPGVQAGTEGFSGLFVRGGSSDQNLVMLDGVPIYNADHLLGVFSIFQSEAVKNVSLYKGAFPARYGGRVSSVVDVRTNDGNLKKAGGMFSVGIISDKLHLEGPIKKDKTSYSISARTVHSLLFTPFVKELKDNNYYFADLNAKVSHQFNDRNRTFVNVYWGGDHLSTYEHYHSSLHEPENDTPYATSTYRDKTKLNWGNLIVAGRWNHVVNQKLFGNLTIAYNRYRMRMDVSSRQINVNEAGTFNYLYHSDYRSGIQDWSGRLDFDYTPVHNHQVKFGGEFIFHTFRPEVMNSQLKEGRNDEVLTDTIYKNANSSQLIGREYTLYAEDHINLSEKVSINIGVHLNGFYTQKKNYIVPQPRLAARYVFSDDWSVKAGYSKMAQYVHLLSSTQITMPTDLWVPITKNIKPMTADQYSAGLYYSGLKGWEFSVEGYYKQLHHVLEYQDGMSFMGSSANWENKVEMGEGRSFGAELLIQKTTGKTTGWLAYTLSKTDRQFKNGFINNGERFPYKYDRRHNLSAVLNHRFNYKWDVGVSWIFNSGGYMTVPERLTYSITPDGNGYYDLYVPRRNNYHLPASHRLNVSINLHRKLKKQRESIWNLSFYNIYNAMNPNLVFVETRTPDYWATPQKEDGLTVETIDVKVKKLTILPIVPSFSYTLKF